MTAPRYSVIVPVYGNEGSLPELVERLEALAPRLDAGMEVVFVVDGSPDDSEAVLHRLLAERALLAQVLVHSRNFGSFAAVRAGMAAARGEYLGVMAADLQEPPELVLEFFREMATGRWDVVVGRRRGRKDPIASRVSSSLSWSFYRRFIQKDMPPGGVDVFGCTKHVAQTLLSLAESNSSLVGLLYWVGFRRTEVDYERLERRHGRSGWSFGRKLRYFLDSVFSFTSFPVTVILTIGVAGTALSFIAAIVVFASWAAGGIDVPGYAATMLVLLLSTGSILSALGIVGTYVWRAFENTKGRPSSVVMTTTRYGDADAGLPPRG